MGYFDTTVVSNTECDSDPSFSFLDLDDASSTFPDLAVLGSVNNAYSAFNVGPFPVPNPGYANDSYASYLRFINFIVDLKTLTCSRINALKIENVC